MDTRLFTAIDVICFMLMNFLPISGAVVLAKRIAADSKLLKYALAGLIYFIQITVIFSLLGIWGLIGLPGAIIGSLLTGAGCVFCAHKFFPAADAEMHTEEKFCRFTLFFKILSGLFVALMIFKATVLGGTDAYLYHLYYPAMWIAEGKIFAITIPGLPHEYFPIAGETLYGWLMLSGNVVFPPLLQIAAWLMSLAAVAAVWRSYGVPERHLAAGTFLAVAFKIVWANAVLCYTDVLTGAFLVTGVALLILAHDGKVSECRNKLVLAVLAGVSMGLAAGTKYSGLVLAPPVALLLLIIFYIRRPENRVCSRVTAVAAVVSGGAFYMPNFLKTGNPFYPVRIPFLFPQGIDFERDTIPLKNMWSYFVNNNPWDLNIFSALLLLTLIAGIFLLGFRKFGSQNKEIARLSLTLLAIFAVAEIFMLSIYPAMTQARQIIPFVMALSMFFAPVLFIFSGKLLKGKFPIALYTGLVTAAGLINLHKSLWLFVPFVILAIVLTVLPIRAGRRKFAAAAAVSVFVIILYIQYTSRFSSALNYIRIFSGSIGCDIVTTLRRDTTAVSGHRIASVGSWYNYILMLDMPANRVFYVPVNEENSSHPHKVASVADLRDKPVAYPVWKQRLLDAGCNYLLVDLKAHADYLTNRDLELRWALEHPEDFELLHSMEDIYFFRINFKR